MKRQKLKKWDFILILSALLIIIVSFIIMTFAEKEEGISVSISIRGEEIGLYSLEENQEIPVKGYNNEYNLVIIENGYVYVNEANCKNQLCVNHKKISKSGESIICLPHGLTIEITGNKNDMTVDTVTY